MRVAVLLTLASLLLTLGSPVAAAEVALPPVGGRFDYQIGGAHTHSVPLDVVVRDRHDAPLEDAYNVCYVNAFQTQAEQTRRWQRPDRRGLLLRVDGRPVADEAWGEWLFDLRKPAKRERLARIVGRWVDGCAEAGYDAVELDNLDSFLRSDGLLRPRHNRRYARLLVARAHEAGLAVAQKNWAELGTRGPKIGFDFAMAEECARYDECGAYAAAYDGRVLVVEYRRRDLDRACARWPELSVVLRDRAVSSGGKHGWCPHAD